MRRWVVNPDLFAVRLVKRVVQLSALDSGQQLVLNVFRQLDTDRVVLVTELVANVASVGPGRCLGLGRRAKLVRGAVSPGREEGRRW